MADQAILTSLAVSASPKGRYLCSKDDLSCAGPDRGDLGLALIGARSSRASSAALAALLRYRLDAGLFEDYDCYVLKNGKLFRNYLVSLRPIQLETRCRSELVKLVQTRKQSFDGLDPTQVCRDPISIQQQVKDLIGAINQGRTCSSEDF